MCDRDKQSKMALRGIDNECMSEREREDVCVSRRQAERERERQTDRETE
jgi:hypothetical protein